MDIVTLTLLAIGLILFFGFFSEFTFKKTGIPDVLFLIVLGFVIGPHVFNFVTPASLANIAPVFTTFTLLFLLFDGAFNINLASLIKEFSSSFLLTIFNFVISSVVITIIMYLFHFPLSISLIAGFALGGVSSAFVIPVLKQMNVKPKIFSLLSLESALTDVFCIVFALTVIEFIRIGGGFGFQKTLSQLVALFAVGAVVGIVAGIIWTILVIKVFKEHNYMITIAYIIIIYVLAQFLQGNGAIATLFFGLVLNNSKQLTSIFSGITSNVSEKKLKKKNIIKGDLGKSVTTRSEEFFYHQVSFLLKTFFFVYVGVLIDLTDLRALLIGVIITVVLLFTRRASWLLTKKDEPQDRKLVNSIFARGLAAAAIAQIALQQGVPFGDQLSKIVYVVITGTIISSSVMMFFVKRKLPKIKFVK